MAIVKGFVFFLGPMEFYAFLDDLGRGKFFCKKTELPHHNKLNVAKPNFFLTKKIWRGRIDFFKNKHDVATSKFKKK